MRHLLGFSHVSLSVRDLEASRGFYCDVLGFQVFERLDEKRYREAILVHPASGTILCLQQHDANAGEPFEPQRTGLDHVAFRVGERSDLDEWASRLAELGVPHSPVADRPYGSVLCARDPDQIQLEIFYRPDLPGH
jgi:glyoxylase I family protein